MNDTTDRLSAVLAQFDGRETDITDAGRDNMRTVNRLSRICALRRVGGETTFRHNVSYYQVEGQTRQIVIGAERAGGGIWRLVARWRAE
jgi:hypothetical protein